MPEFTKLLGRPVAAFEDRKGTRLPVVRSSVTPRSAVESVTDERPAQAELGRGTLKSGGHISEAARQPRPRLGGASLFFPPRSIITEVASRPV
jgi:hypothetical protein